MPATRPEFENPPEIFYNATEARSYTLSTRVRKVQRDMTLRALELINLPGPSETDMGRNHSSLLLDLGCGSGISGDVLTEQGHAWVGVDVSADMLAIAKEDELRHYELIDDPASKLPTEITGSLTRVDLSHVKWGLITEDEVDTHETTGERESESGADDPVAAVTEGPRMVEVLRNDVGQGIPFRPGTFDGCVSISAIQWLCHSSKRGEVPQHRLMALFQSVYNALKRGAKAVFQFYPSGPDQIHMITRAAMKCGFKGGVVIDFPHSSRAKKHYLVLQAGDVAGGFVPPPGLTDEVAGEGDSESDSSEEYPSSDFEDDDAGIHSGRKRVRVGGRERADIGARRVARAAHDRKRRRKDNRPVTGTRDWVLLKKEERRHRGLATTADSKYTMRRRKPRF